MNNFFVIYVNVLNLYHNMNKHISCRFCQSGEEETQEHLEVCVGCDYERRGLKMSVESGEINLLQQIIMRLVL